ncbi:hypothetical protein BGZ98_002056, partial [Dissophora globulifera]
MAAISNTTTITAAIADSVAAAPAVAFAEPERRGRDHTVTPLVEEDSTTTDTNPMSDEKKKTHRNSLAAFAERLRSRSRSHSRHHSTDSDLPLDRSTTQASTNSTSSRKSSKSRSGSRSRSSLELENSPLAEVVRAQNEFMEKLRDEQERNNITHNVDGIPIPP